MRVEHAIISAMSGINPGKLKELEPVFFPKSIAVVGASSDKQKTGYQYVDSLLSLALRARFTRLILRVANFWG